MQVGEPTAALYAKQAPELLEFITGTGENCMMKRDAMTDYCVKFENGLCSIHKKYGTDFLGDACNFYPRMTRALGNTRIMTGALSCPEITRLALFAENSFSMQQSSSERFPSTLVDYLPETMDEAQALAIHQAFLTAALDTKHSAAHNLMRIFCVAESLEKIPVTSWPDAVPFYLEHAASRVPAPEHSQMDPFFTLQALCGLIAAAKKGQHERLMHNVHLMEKALHVTIQWDNLAIAHLPDSQHAASSLANEWNEKWSAQYDELLRRYLAAQISLALFPFSGLGDTLTNRLSIIGVRFATIRLTLMSACRVMPELPGMNECTTIIQTLSRFLDHLAGAEFSLNIYRETGWLKAARLRALIGDTTA